MGVADGVGVKERERERENIKQSVLNLAAHPQQALSPSKRVRGANL